MADLCHVPCVLVDAACHAVLYMLLTPALIAVLSCFCSPWLDGHKWMYAACHAVLYLYLSIIIILLL